MGALHRLVGLWAVEGRADQRRNGKRDLLATATKLKRDNLIPVSVALLLKHPLWQFARVFALR